MPAICREPAARWFMQYKQGCQDYCRYAPDREQAHSHACGQNQKRIRGHQEFLPAYIASPDAAKRDVGAGRVEVSRSQRRWARDGPSVRPGGAAPEGGSPAGAQPG